MINRTTLSLTALTLSLFNTGATQAVTFNDDVELLKQKHQPIILTNGNSRLAVLAEYQGRAMVSSMAGDSGQSIGWMDRQLLQQDLSNVQNLNVGGVSRLWYGPEKGPYALFFKPGKEQVVETIHYPDAMTHIAFDVVKQSSQQVEFNKTIQLTNHMGTDFTFDVNRRIELFDREQLVESLGVPIPLALDAVGFSAKTQLTNASTKTLSRDKGLVAIWELGCFYPNATVAIPMEPPLAEITSYFTPLKHSHTRVKGNTVFYKADASYLNKIGIRPAQTKPIMGSYNAELNMLTVVKFQFKPPADGTYVNSEWVDDVDPYAGDVTNIFNHGIQQDGKAGPFYEMETSSHASELSPGQSTEHYHNTYHFSGNKKQLSRVSEALLGVTLQQLQQAFDSP
ncbi:DUF6786 family protein [Echinimonas agarilytica]|uniref:Aldose 1-epimerase n=1 Tax=Echinimonas agarilytica TaxID=1215918 RepID=A0AA41WBG5_9GAMM|nr:DUF6786 family protein [Echinimonas agarilytica]MCM2681261.1 hypothetical protein [Echinimonas agarilytica]